jgi:hypothetical protein
MNIPPGGPVRQVPSLSDLVLSWMDVQPDLRDLRLGFNASPEETSYVLHLYGVSGLSFSLQPGDKAPYTVVDAFVTEQSSPPGYVFHVEGDAIVDVVCSGYTVYTEQ